MGLLDKLFPKKNADAPESEEHFISGGPLEIFVRNFTHNGGKFLMAQNEEQVRILLKAILLEEDKESYFFTDDTVKNSLLESLPSTGKLSPDSVYVSFVEYLIKDQGGIMLSSIQTNNLSVRELPKTAVFVASPSQLVEDVGEGMSRVNKLYKVRKTDPPRVHTLHHFNEDEEDTFRKNVYLILMYE